MPESNNPPQANSAWQSNSYQFKNTELIQPKHSFQTFKTTTMIIPNINIYVNTNPIPPEKWFSMSEAAKLINRKIGRNCLFRFLREQSVLMKNNEPYQSFIDRGYFKLVTKTIIKNLYNQPVTVVSTKGIEFINNLLKNKLKNDQ